VINKTEGKIKRKIHTGRVTFMTENTLRKKAGQEEAEKRQRA